MIGRAVNGRALTEGSVWLLAGAAALLFAYWAEHGLGMAPCALCLWERWPYRLLIAIGAVWIVLGLFGRRAGPLRLLVILVTLAATALGVLHFGVEQHWWPSPLPECAAPHFSGGSFAERLASMPSRPTKPCDAANYPIAALPVSFVLLAALYAGILLLVALVADVRSRRRRRLFGPR